MSYYSEIEDIKKRLNELETLVRMLISAQAEKVVEVCVKEKKAKDKKDEANG